MNELQFDTSFVMPRVVATRLLTAPDRLSNKTRKRCQRAREKHYRSVAPIATEQEIATGEKAYVGYYDHAITHITALAIPSEQKTGAKLKTFAIAKLGRMVKRCDIRRRMLQHAFEKTTLEKFKQELSLRADRLDRLRDLVVEEINSRDYPVRIIDPRILRREALLDAIGI